MSQKISSSTALIIVDVQNDFLPGGALAVHKGDEIIAYINSIMPKYPLVLATRDWHPSGHISFASNHTGTHVGDVIMLPTKKSSNASTDQNGAPTHISQILWPDHCVQGTLGAEISAKLSHAHISCIIDKGYDIEIDSYSGFFDSNGNKTTLDDVLKTHGVDTVHICGLATDYCVKFTAYDCVRLGYHTVLLTQGIRAVNLAPQDGDEAIEFMKKHNINIET